MLQLFHLDATSVASGESMKRNEEIYMTLTTKRILILCAVALVAFAAGRLAVRAGLNALVGGTLWGGNFL